jgi:hypothetical protein
MTAEPEPRDVTDNETGEYDPAVGSQAPRTVPPRTVPPRMVPPMTASPADDALVDGDLDDDLDDDLDEGDLAVDDDDVVILRTDEVDEVEPGSVIADQAGSPEAPDTPEAPVATPEGERWHEILAGFVDDPRSSLQAASEIVKDDASAFVALLGRWEESLTDQAQGDRGGETEKMRQALVIYRDISKQLAASTKALG